jgi:hypothetical protein
MAAPADHRIDRLEIALSRLSEEVATYIRETRRDMAEYQAREDRRSELARRELADFKSEMADFKSEMADFKSEMAELKARMDVYCANMDRRSEESRQDRRDLHRELGEIARSQGRLVEDIAAPSVPRVLRAWLGLPEHEQLDWFAVRLRKRHPEVRGEHVEIDVLAVHGRTALVVEVKGRPTPGPITAFAESLPRIREFLPELAERSPWSGPSQPSTWTRRWSPTSSGSGCLRSPRATTCSTS